MKNEKEGHIGYIVTSVGEIVKVDGLSKDKTQIKKMRNQLKSLFNNKLLVRRVE